MAIGVLHRHPDAGAMADMRSVWRRALTDLSRFGNEMLRLAARHQAALDGHMHVAGDDLGADRRAESGRFDMADGAVAPALPARLAADAEP